MDFNQFYEAGWVTLRLVMAIVFIYHAWPKLKNPEAVAGGVGMSVNSVRVLGLVEFLGGLAIGLGVFMVLSALALSVVMIGAIYYKVHKWKVPFYAHDKTGWEYDFVLLAVLLFILTNA